VSHDELFAEYVKELRAVKDAALAWWAELIAESSSEHGDRAEAVLRERWPFGPTSHPWVIAVYRAYWLACHRLNREIEATSGEPEEPSDPDAGWGEDGESPAVTIPPNVFAVDMLSGGENEDLYDFILSLMYVPIGTKHEEPE
jgi:hypothetical protein